MQEKVALVLEGGSMRGMFTAGVLDIFLENNIEIDLIIGVSAGALFGVNYFSKQKGRALRYNKRFCQDRRYISKESLILTGNVVNKNFAFYKVTKDLEPFSDSEFIKTNKDYYVVVTNVEKGLPEYIKLDKVIPNLEYLRATSAIPLAAKIVKIGEKKYLDGAICDSIPYKKAMDLGYKKIIVVLTQPMDYIKEPFTKGEEKIIRLKYRKYPEFIKAILNRYNMYNEEVKEIKRLENEGKLFVIRPPKKLDINIIERNKDKIQEVYDIGVNEAKENLDKLNNYLQK